MAVFKQTHMKYAFINELNLSERNFLNGHAQVHRLKPISIWLGPSLNLQKKEKPFLSSDVHFMLIFYYWICK